MGFLEVLLGLTVVDEVLNKGRKQNTNTANTDEFDPEQDCAECGEYWEDCECDDCDCDEENF